ncbi:unnamed protein product, partial [Prorocentrum cordatum]
SFTATRTQSTSTTPSLTSCVRVASTASRQMATGGCCYGPTTRARSCCGRCGLRRRRTTSPARGTSGERTSSGRTYPACSGSTGERTRSRHRASCSRRRAAVPCT